MNILIIQGDPDQESFCHANALNYYQTAQNTNHNVTLIDLAIDQFDPVLRYGYRKHMDDEQYPNKMKKLITTADHIVFFFPIWWSAEPAILKGWIDRVITPQFGYIYKDNKTVKLLKGKTAEMFLTSHAPTFFYSLYGGVVSRWKHFILGFCGIKLTHHIIMGKMDSKIDTVERRQQFMNKCAQRVHSLR